MKSQKNILADYDLKGQDFFRTALLSWYKQYPKRELPWKEGKNAYNIWLAEIMLQQTRVEQGLPYYKKFIKAFPRIEDLAAAAEDHVLKLWQGLGYYARARNLHYTAKYITEQHQAIFPSTYKEIRALKGVGDYTAAAIASFAFDLPYAVLDGNVYRVLARFFGLALAIDSTEGKKVFAALAQQLLDVEQAADFNQAMMDLGALICSPKKPNCSQCPFKTSCKALGKNQIDQLPFKAKKLKKKDRYFNYLVWQDPKQYSILQKRQAQDIWKGLYQFPLIETAAPQSSWSVSELRAEHKPLAAAEFTIVQQSQVFRQQLSHQHIHATFIKIEGDIPETFSQCTDFEIITQEELKDFAVPKIIQQYLSNWQLSLFD